MANPFLMKTRFTFFCLLLLLGFFDINAQNGFPGVAIVPLKMNRSPLFGKDIVINDMPDRD
jgi:hypothetical protein